MIRGFIFPGQAYTHAHPLLHYAAAALVEAGVEVLRVEDNNALTEVEGAAGGAGGVVLVGKSIGTRAMATLLDRGLLGVPVVGAAWLTPLIGNDQVFDAMRACPARAVTVIGGADPYYLPDRLAALPSSHTVITVPDADHALEVPGNVERSIDALRRTTTAIRDLALA